MNTNYYEVLEITRGATAENITQAFKRLAHKYAPQKNNANAAAHADKFSQICEAYDVLNDNERKAIFDTYGEYGLKNGVTNHQGQKIGGYMFLNNSQEIYDAFFLSTDPLRDCFEVDATDMYGSLMGDCHGGKHRKRPDEPADVELSLACSLYEFYNGSVKAVCYERDEIHPNGRTIAKTNEEIQVEIKPGYKENMIITFAGKGNE